MKFSKQEQKSSDGILPAHSMLPLCNCFVMLLLKTRTTGVFHKTAQSLVHPWAFILGGHLYGAGMVNFQRGTSPNVFYNTFFINSEINIFRLFYGGQCLNTV